MAPVWIIACVLATQAEIAPPGQFAPPQSLMPVPAAPLPGSMNAGGQNIAENVAPASATEPIAAPPTGNGAPRNLTLAPPGAQRAAGGKQRTPPSAGRTVTTVLSSLAIVLGLFFAFVWVARKGAPTAAGQLPSEVVQVLGRASLAPRQQMQLVRIGDKLLLVVVTASGAQTLTEITDRAEVERLAAACEATRGTSATANFRQVLSQLENEPAVGGFFGRTEQPAAANTRANGRRTRPAEQSHA